MQNLLYFQSLLPIATLLNRMTVNQNTQRTNLIMAKALTKSQIAAEIADKNGITKSVFWNSSG